VVEVKSETRTILAHILYSNQNSENLGTVRPVAEIVDGKLEIVSTESFCPTMKVFITGGYDELARRYPLPQLFRLQVSLNTNPSENVDPSRYSRYVANSKQAEALKPKEFFEIISAPLPDANNRAVGVDRIPGTRYIFADDGNDVYGPFKWELRQDSEGDNIISLDFIDTILPPFDKLVKYQIYRIDRKKVFDKTLSIAENGISTHILYDISVAQNAIFFDYSSDEEILRYTAKLAQDVGSKLIEKSKFDSLTTLITKSNPKHNNPLVKQRFSRLQSIVTAASELQTEVISDLTNYLKSDYGQIIVNAYIEKNKDIYLGKLRQSSEEALKQQLADLYDKIKQSRDRITELDEEKRILSADVEKKRREAKEAPNLQAEHAKVDALLSLKREELAELERRLAERIVHDRALNSLDDVRRRITDEERARDRAVTRHHEAQSSLREIQFQVNQEESKLRQRLNELKPYVDAINGTYVPDAPAAPAIAVATNPFSDDRDLVERQREVTATVRRALADSGRAMEEWQVANLLISTQQSFITIFAGLPGVGKTSLARLLGDVQRISTRTKEVAVARGWTSQKDLIGFFNPLTNRFQSSGTGMYEFLRALDGEKDVALQQAMAYVLLDEANLSPIEHYWSAFMGMADQEGLQQLTLGNQTVQIPKHLRFLATINYDGTTEPLSPRISDRASIILIEPQDAEADLDVLNSENGAKLPISAKDMNILFGNEMALPELTEEESAAFKQIRSILLKPDAQQGKPLQISTRKENAIRQYCNKARGIMGANNESLLALDMAVRQHVLPQVRGTDRFGKRLDTLQREMHNSGLKRSAAFAARMIENGDHDLRTYDFFCW
jgi:hypothetical protein